MSKYCIDLEDFRGEVVRMYDEYLMKTEHRGISWGELAHIDGLNKKGLQGLYKELCEQEGEKEND